MFHFLEFFLGFSVFVFFAVQEITPFSILAASFDEVGLALFGFVFKVAFGALPELFDSMCELAFIVVSAKPSIEEISTQFVF